MKWALAGMRTAAAGFLLSAGMLPFSSLAGDQLPPQANAIERDGIIFERQLIMLQLEKDAELLGNIAAGIEPPSKLAATTAAIARSASDAAASFAEPIPGGRARPEVWSNKADFDARMAVFVKNAEKMAAAGQSGNVAAVTELIIDAMPCKQCHDTYRAPKKP